MFQQVPEFVLQSKSMDWFLCDRDLRHERVKDIFERELEWIFPNNFCSYRSMKEEYSLHKKWSFPLRIFSVNVTKSAVSCGFCHILKKFLIQNFICSAVTQRISRIINILISNVWPGFEMDVGTKRNWGWGYINFLSYIPAF